MKITHINLLQRKRAERTVSAALGLLLGVTLIGLVWYGKGVLGEASEATRQRDDIAQQIKQTQDAIAAISSEQARNAGAIALRMEVESLQPQADAARRLVDAMAGSRSVTGEDMARTMSALGTAREAGLWLTGINLTAGGQNLEIIGEARSGVAAMRYAQKINEALKPFSRRLDSLELRSTGNTAAAAGAAAAAPANGSVTFRLF